MKTDSTAYTVIFSFLIAFVFVFLLAVANEGTREQVEYNQKLALQRSVLNAFGIEYQSPDDIISTYETRVEQETVGGLELYRAEVDGRTAYAKTFLENALWGSVLGVLAVNEDVSRTVGIEIIEHNETPGLGGRIDEQWFKKQFRNERIEDGAIEMRLRGGGEGDTDPENATVDAITGATLTSQYIRDIVNREIARYRQALGGQ